MGEAAGRKVLWMIMLTGDTQSKEIVLLLQKHGWGRMLIDRTVKLYPGEPWGFDNGAFRDWKNGNSFNDKAFLSRLDKIYSLGRPILSVVPDLVAQGKRSLEFSLDWLEKLPQDWPWYLALQDGMIISDIEPIINRFTGLFLGGTDKFKSTALWWCRLAHKHGKKFHYARAGTQRKLRHARIIRADSCDSAFPLWKKDRLEHFMCEWVEGNSQIELWGPEIWSMKP